MYTHTPHCTLNFPARNPGVSSRLSKSHCGARIGCTPCPQTHLRFLVTEKRRNAFKFFCGEKKNLGLRYQRPHSSFQALHGTELPKDMCADWFHFLWRTKMSVLSCIFHLRRQWITRWNLLLRHGRQMLTRVHKPSQNKNSASNYYAPPEYLWNASICHVIGTSVYVFALVWHDSQRLTENFILVVYYSVP